MRVAEAWASGNHERNEGPIDALRAMGCDDATIAEARSRLGIDAPADAIEVLPVCWHAVMLFLGMSSQWEWVTPPMAAPRRVRMCFEALPAVDAGTRIRPRRLRQPMHVLLPQLRVMQAAALAVWNK